MKANGPINVPELVTITNNNAAAGLIDATANLANHKVWLFSGTWIDREASRHERAECVLS